MSTEGSGLGDVFLDERAAELFERLEGDDEAAREQLVEHYYSLAESLARRFDGYGEPLDDLVQVASIGLLKAVDRFDPSRGYRFSTYATPTIIGELKRHFRDRGWAVRMPRKLQENSLRLRSVVAQLSQELRRSPTVQEISEHSGMTAEEVLEASDALDAYSGVSLDAPINEDDDGRTSIERLGGEDDRIDLVEGWADLEPYLLELPERERTILYLRFFQGWTQSKIAEEVDISQMHVSRLLSRTLKDLRKRMGGSADQAK